MAIDEGPVKGRGASGVVPNRFLSAHYGTVHPEGVDGPAEASNATRYLAVHAKTIVNPVNSPDLPFRWSMNPYQGCEHGCAYCYARPTHEYWGYDAGLDFERTVLVKRNAPELLERQLRSKGWKGEPITIAGATDPYQPIERTEGTTRRLLEVAWAFRQPVSIITKNALVLRDLDLLAPMAGKRLAAVAISICTLNEDLRRRMEPRTSTIANRLHAMRTLADAGVPVFAMVAPVIPALTEPEIPAVLRASSEAGAVSAGYTVLRLNGAVELVFTRWLEHHFPDRAGRVLHQVRNMHQGRLSDSRPGLRMKGEGPLAVNIARLFLVMRRRYFGKALFPPLDSTLFRLPLGGQLDLFGGHGTG